MMKEMWDERYGAELYVYGKSPNEYFRDKLDQLTPGKLLMPGEGEGRNAVYAALKGWEVDAFDFSASGYNKAMALAAERQVNIRYEISDVDTFHFKSSCYDVVGLIFFHMPGAHRKRLHQQVIHSLKPGGMIILEGFHVSQLGKRSGGPQSMDFLFDEEKLRSDFHGMELRELEWVSRQLDEGPFHSGEASLIRCIAIKTS